MFLSMMTADAAAAHSRECSSTRDALLQTKSSASVSASPIRSRSPLSLFTTSPLSPVTPQQPTVKCSAPSPAESTPPKSPRSIMFVEPDVRSEGALSRPATADSAASSEGKPKKKTPRSKIAYNLAHPPPTAGPRQKLHLRPRVLLQLQQSSPSSSRPKPAYDVLPASKFVPRLAITKKLIQTVKGKDRLGPDDIIVAKANDYGPVTEEEDGSEDECLGRREIVGAICVGKKDETKGTAKTEICIDDGTVWEVTTMANGGYEFVSTDEHGLQLKVRWVARRPNRRMSGTYEGRGPGAAAGEDKKFNFSTISPDTRRHPIIASMTRASIDVLDTYTLPAGSSVALHSPLTSPIQTPLATPSVWSETSSLADGADAWTENSSMRTTEALRKLILVTGIWVAFRESWSTVFRYTPAGPAASVSASSPWPSSPRPVGPTRTVSMPLRAPSNGGTSTPPPDAEDSRRTSFPKILRGTGDRIGRSDSGASRTSAPGAAVTTTTTASTTRTRRANSTGTTTSTTSFLRRPRDATPVRRSPPAVLLESENERSSGRSSLTLQAAAVVADEKKIPDVRSVRASEPPPPILVTSPTVASTTTASTTTQPASPNPPPPPQQPRIHSAYLPPTNTTGLWDSGEPAVGAASPRAGGFCERSARARGLGLGLGRPRPRSLDALALKDRLLREEKRRGEREGGRLRRLFGAGWWGEVFGRGRGRGKER